MWEIRGVCVPGASSDSSYSRKECSWVTAISFTAKYGQALSSVINMNTNDSEPHHLAGRPQAQPGRAFLCNPKTEHIDR